MQKYCYSRNETVIDSARLQERLKEEWRTDCILELKIKFYKVLRMYA
jgi:hypothetical protein